MKKNTDRRKIGTYMTMEGVLLAGTAISLFMLSANSTIAYETYNGDIDGGCVDCHGAFTDGQSTKGSVFPGGGGGNKHTMHRSNSYMDTECNLCHSADDGNDPFIGLSDGTANNSGLGCTGCHDKFGLRAHHAINGVGDCADCHDSDGPPPEENVIPPYYGTADTNVDDPSNAVLAENTGENWTIGDFIGTDNDGDNLYDLADYSCGPLRMVEVVPAGNDLLVRWETAGGRSERIQTTVVLTNGFSDVGSTVNIPDVGIVTQEVVLVNGASGSEGFYRVRSNP